MLYVWLSERELFAPTPKDRHRRVRGPIVFDAPSSFGSRAKHPKLLPYRYLHKVERLLDPEVVARLHEEAEALDATSCEKEHDTQHLLEISYRELQEVAKEHGVKASGTHEDLLLRVEAHMGGSREA